ncbi:MAG: hypothetical protein CMB77_05500 [Euryarchaeota archaeon]|nr:hypothetical protein [Euryarchaeota archaeon]
MATGLKRQRTNCQIDTYLQTSRDTFYPRSRRREAIKNSILHPFSNLLRRIPLHRTVDDLAKGPFGVPWTWIPAEVVEVGSSKGAYPFAANGPRHEVNVDGFWVAASEIPILSGQSLEAAEETLSQTPPPDGGLLRLPTESEWVRITSQTSIKPLPFAWTSDEFHTSRWGSPRDGRPWTEARCGKQAPIPEGSSIPRTAVTLRRDGIHRIFPSGGMDSVDALQIPVLIPDAEKDQSPPLHPLPSLPPSNHRRILEEVISFLFFGGAAMSIALYNSPDYALSQPVNILLGGLFVSFASGLFWRPSRPVISLPLSTDEESE